MAQFVLEVNGARHELDVPPDMPLLWALRDYLRLPGTKYGCGVGFCGACTVHIDGIAVRSCVMPVEGVEGQVVTIEGLDQDHPLFDEWIERQVPQCGYCQPGMIMAAAALLRDIPSPSRDDVRSFITNVCRCGTYHRIEEAILACSAPDDEETETS
jgi:isoquinoline 1-oxidoreductase alpha subunit